MSDSEEVTSAASYFNSAQAPVPAPVPPANQQSAASQQLLPPALNQEYLGITNEPPPVPAPVVISPEDDAAHNMASLTIEENVVQEIAQAGYAEVEVQGRLQPSQNDLHSYNDLHSSASVPVPSSSAQQPPNTTMNGEGYFQPSTNNQQNYVHPVNNPATSLRSGDAQPFNFKKTDASSEPTNYSVLASSNEGHQPRNQLQDDQGRARPRAPPQPAPSNQAYSSHSNEQSNIREDVRAPVRPLNPERSSRPPLDEQRPGNRDPNARAPIVPHDSDPTPLNRMPMLNPSAPVNSQFSQQEANTEESPVNNRFSQSNQFLDSVDRDHQQHQQPAAPPEISPSYSQAPPPPQQQQQLHPHQGAPYHPADQYQQHHQHPAPPSSVGGYAPRPQYFHPGHYQPQTHAHQYPHHDAASGRATPGYSQNPHIDRPSRPGSAISARGSDYAPPPQPHYPPAPYGHHHPPPPGPYGYPPPGPYGGYGHPAYPPYGYPPHPYGADPYADPYRRPPYSRLPAWDRYRPSSEFDPHDDNVSVTSFHSQRSGRSGASRRKKKNVYEELYKSMTINYDDAEWQDNFYVDSARDEGRKTPPKFTQPHCIVRFSPTGQLVKVNAARVDEGEAATFELHSLEALTANEPVFAPGLHAYPGPLTRSATPKIDVVRYCGKQAAEVRANLNVPDRQSFALLWDLLALLVRSNDNAEGHDFSELLLGELKTEKQSDEAEESNLEVKADRSVINEANSSASLRNLTTGRGYSETEKVNRFRELIQYGRQRDALEWAMKTGIWGHALMLSYKLDPTQHQKVMSRFLNSMSAGDPLQTAYTFLSGRQPNSLSQIEEGDLGSWREHLAMILSNSTQNQALTRNVYQRSITSLGDTLWNRGLLYASQFCYLLANGVKSFGYCNRKSSKIVLLGGDHTQDFSSFATLSAIQMTEVYEYAISLSSNNTSKSVLHSFQSLKYLYATWLVDYGLITQAFAYLEQIAAVVLQEPHQYHKTLVSRLTGLALRLQLHDQQRLNFTEEASAPQWLERLLSLLASDSAGEEKPTGIHTGAENEANLEAPALSSLAHAISSLREEVNEYEPKIDQSGRVSFSPDPTDSAPASARIPSRLSSTLSEQYIPAPHEYDPHEPVLSPTSTQATSPHNFQTFNNEVPPRTRSRRNTERSEASVSRRGSSSYAPPMPPAQPSTLHISSTPSIPFTPSVPTPMSEQGTSMPPPVSIPPSSEPNLSNTHSLHPYQSQQQNFVPFTGASAAPAVTNNEPPMFMSFNPTSAGPSGPQFPQMTPVSAPIAAPVEATPLEPANVAQQDNFAPAQPQVEQQNGFNYSQQQQYHPLQTPQQDFNQAPPHHEKSQPVAPVQQEPQKFQAPIAETQPHFQPTYSQFNSIPENSAPLSQTGVMPTAPVMPQAPVLPAAPKMPEPSEMPTFHPSSVGYIPPMPKQPSSVQTQFTPAQQQPTPQPVQNEQPLKPEPQKAPTSKANTSASGPSRSFLGSVFRKVLPNSLTGEAYLPDDTNKSLVWDEDKKKWVDLSGGTEEERAPPPPPPTMPMMENRNQMPMGNTGAMSGPLNPMAGAMLNGGAPPAPASNFRRGNKKRNMYKDAKALGETVSVSNKMMPDSAPTPSGVPNPGFFMPQSVPNDGTNGISAGDQGQVSPTQQNGHSSQAANQGGTPAGPGPMFFNPSQFGKGQAPFVPPGSS